jgi:hypothetical protein
LETACEKSLFMIVISGRGEAFPYKIYARTHKLSAGMLRPYKLLLEPTNICGRFNRKPLSNNDFFPRVKNPYKISPSTAPFGFAQGKAQGKAWEGGLGGSMLVDMSHNFLEIVLNIVRSPLTPLSKGGTGSHINFKNYCYNYVTRLI